MEKIILYVPNVILPRLSREDCTLVVLELARMVVKWRHYYVKVTSSWHGSRPSGAVLNMRQEKESIIRVRQASWYQTVIPGTDFSISSSHPWWIPIILPMFSYMYADCHVSVLELARMDVKWRYCYMCMLKWQHHVMPHLIVFRNVWESVLNIECYIWWWERKIIHYSCEDGIKKIRPEDHRSAPRGKIRPSQSPFAITRQASLWQTVILGTDCSIQYPSWQYRQRITNVLIRLRECFSHTARTWFYSARLIYTIWRWAKKLINVKLIAAFTNIVIYKYANLHYWSRSRPVLDNWPIKWKHRGEIQSIRLYNALFRRHRTPFSWRKRRLMADKTPHEVRHSQKST